MKACIPTTAPTRSLISTLQTGVSVLSNLIQMCWHLTCRVWRTTISNLSQIHLTRLSCQMDVEAQGQEDTDDQITREVVEGPGHQLRRVPPTEQH